MQYFSTNGASPLASLKEAISRGLAPDKGLYMPERIEVLPSSFFYGIDDLTFHEIAVRVAEAFFGEDVQSTKLKEIVEDTLSFDCPVVEVEKDIYSLELFHGPTLAFKDVGARFMARMLAYFLSQDEATKGKTINVLVATSGDTGSAVANGFLGIKGIKVFVLYPSGRVSPIQECQFTTLGRNITALEIAGTFDDCQALVKNAFMDKELSEAMTLTSANSINVARFLPQSFYYFNAYAQMKRLGKGGNVVCCVPSGNFGNICSALFAKRMGLPIARFIAANNSNDVFLRYLQTGTYTPADTIPTLANAMDVGNPSNFARIYSLYDGNWERIKEDVDGARVTDDQILSTISDCHHRNGYTLDPHGACAYKALREGLRGGESGFFCETAHPAKFKDTVEGAIGKEIEIPKRLLAFMKGEKKSIALGKDFNEFKAYLLENR